MRMTPQSKSTPRSKIRDETVITIVEQDLDEEDEEKLSKASPNPKLEIDNGDEEGDIELLENEHEVKKNLHSITLEYAQSVEDYQNDTEEILKKLEEIEGKQNKFRKNWELHKATFLGTRALENMSPDTKKIYEEVNKENELDIEDLRELNQHKKKELEKIKIELTNSRRLNEILRDQLQTVIPDNPDEISEKTKKISTENRKKVQPLLGENEMMNLKLGGLQTKRRALVTNALKGWEFPTIYFSEVERLRKETEKSYFLQKDKAEQDITLNALEDVLSGHKKYYATLSDLFKIYETGIQDTVTQLNKELKSRKEDNERIEPKGKISPPY